MSLTNPNTPVSQQDLQDFYHKILPYMGGSSGGGGHTIEDSEGTDLTQRDTLQFGEGFLAEDDSTNEKTVISPDVMQSGDVSDVITPLPTVPIKMPVLFDESGAERVVGWYKYANGTKKPVYEKTFDILNPVTSTPIMENVEFAVLTNCNTYRSQNGNSDCQRSYYVNGNDFANICLFNVQNTSPTYLNFWFNKGGSITIDRVVFTVQYTKTTDTAE